MKYLFLPFFLFLFVTHTRAITPLPPISSQAEWVVSVATQLGLTEKIYTYGDLYHSCGHVYVAVVEDGEEEILYLRMTDDKVYYILSLDDCANERLMYDYSTQEEFQVDIRKSTDISGGFHDVTVYPQLSTGVSSILGAPIVHISFAHFSWYDINGRTAYWYKGIGDLEHPFFPLFNNYDWSAEVSYHLKSLKVDNMLWYCRNNGLNQECMNNGVIYVDKDVTEGVQDGSSWENAFQKLEDALNVAMFGDVIWLAEGEYKLPMDSERNASFELRDGIGIYGGFEGTETYFTQRDPSVYITILSGDIGTLGNTDDNVYHVVHIKEVQHYAVLDGLQITAGNANDGVAGYLNFELGGGIMLSSSEAMLDTVNIVINNCDVLNNKAIQGGAIAFHSSYSLPTTINITNSQINNNDTEFFGGAIYIPNLYTDLQWQLNAVEFVANTAVMGGGGAIYDYNDYSDWHIYDGIFENNTVENGEGGAIGFYNGLVDAELVVWNTDFINNISSTDGASININYVVVSEGSLQSDFHNCEFIGNRSIHGTGGGIAIAMFEPLDLGINIDKCVFEGNRSFERGGAIGIFSYGAWNKGKLGISSCIFENNVSGSSLGGAIRVYILATESTDLIDDIFFVNIENSIFALNRGAIVQTAVNSMTAIVDSIKNCTFYNNGIVSLAKSAINDVPDGSVYKNEIYLKNSILWEPDIPLEQLLYNGNPNELSIYDYELDHCLISVSECDLPGEEEACYTHPNYFNIDPMFRDSAQNDFRLLPCSPFVNAGELYSDMPILDLSGDLRIQEGQVDLGAFETKSFTSQIDSLFHQLSCFGDNTGWVDASGVNITDPVEYDLVSDAFSQNNETGYFSELGVGNYELFVRDSVGCRNTLGFEITSPDSLSLSFDIMHYQSDMQDGSIRVDSISGGVEPYSLYFDEMLLHDSIISNLIPDSYLISVEDSLGCTLDSLIEILLIDETEEVYEQAGFSVYPNPVRANSSMYLVLEATNIFQNEDVYFELYNIEGQRLSAKRMVHPNIVVEYTTPSSSGEYFLVLRSGVEIVGAKKLIIQH